MTFSTVSRSCCAFGFGLAICAPRSMTGLKALKQRPRPKFSHVSMASRAQRGMRGHGKTSNSVRGKRKRSPSQYSLPSQSSSFNYVSDTSELFREAGLSSGPLSNTGSVQSLIQWYPGHIAKAERSLKDSLRLVDVVIEVRDCRIPIATAHPEVKSWVGSKPLVLAMNKADLVPDASRSVWRQYLTSQGYLPRFLNAKEGRGIRELKKLALSAGSEVNAKRSMRGLRPRPIRCLVMGYPNVGKSAVINRLVGRRAARSENKPGVTRNFQWIRISDTIELLDMPGIIPPKLVSQDTALRLAICDDIGQGGYDAQIVAGLMIDELSKVSKRFPGFADLSLLEERFKVDPFSCSGEDYLHLSAKKLTRGDLGKIARRLLTEFRAGDLGRIALESPSMLSDPDS